MTATLDWAYKRQAEKLLDKCVRVPLKGNQREALLSLLYDIVSGACHGNGVHFEDSKLLKALNAGEFQIAASSFFAFAHRGRRVDAALWAKRNDEQLLFRR
jgi:GH24 family phage-related lysozyme (muramidase)